jgi:hypothetical protein
MDSSKQDNWLDAPGYRGSVLSWKKVQGAANRHILFVTVNNENWRIRLNDFPDEPLYTLIVNGRDVIHFNEWPSEWEKEQ